VSRPKPCPKTRSFSKDAVIDPAMALICQVFEFQTLIKLLNKIFTLNALVQHLCRISLYDYVMPV